MPGLAVIAQPEPDQINEGFHPLLGSYLIYWYSRFIGNIIYYIYIKRRDQAGVSVLYCVVCIYICICVELSVVEVGIPFGPARPGLWWRHTEAMCGGDVGPELPLTCTFKLCVDVTQVGQLPVTCHL